MKIEKAGKYPSIEKMAREKEKSHDKESGRYHHGDLRQALIDGALEIIGDGDVQALSLRALARKVGVSYAAPYHHFSDKTELLAELAVDGYKKLNAEMTRQQEMVRDDPSDSLVAAGRAYLFFAVSHPSHYRVMFSLKKLDEYPPLKVAADECFQRLLENTRAVLGNAAPEETIVGLANLTWATVHGAATLWNDGPMCKHLKSEDLAAYVEMVTGQMGQLILALAGSLERRSDDSS